MHADQDCFAVQRLNVGFFSKLHIVFRGVNTPWQTAIQRLSFYQDGITKRSFASWSRLIHIHLQAAMNVEASTANLGAVSWVSESVMDMPFDRQLPPIYSGLDAGAENKIVIEVLAKQAARHCAQARAGARAQPGRGGHRWTVENAGGHPTRDSGWFNRYPGGDQTQFRLSPRGCSALQWQKCGLSGISHGGSYLDSTTKCKLQLKAFRMILVNEYFPK